LRLLNVVVERVAVIKFTVNNRCGNGTGSFEVTIGADTAKFTNVITTRFRERDEIWSDRKSEMKGDFGRS